MFKIVLIIRMIDKNTHDAWRTDVTHWTRWTLNVFWSHWSLPPVDGSGRRWMSMSRWRDVEMTRCRDDSAHFFFRMTSLTQNVFGCRCQRSLMTRSLIQHFLEPFDVTVVNALTLSRTKILEIDDKIGVKMTTRTSGSRCTTHLEDQVSGSPTVEFISFH